MGADVLCLSLLSTLLTLSNGQTGEAVNTADLCAGMKCRHESPCKTIMTRSGSQETVTAQCACHGVWLGPRCEAEIILGAHITSSTSIEIIIKFDIPDPDRTNKTDDTDDFLHRFLQYSLHYWRNDTRESCSVIPHLTAAHYVISSLVPDTLYYFCAEPNNVDICYPLRNAPDFSSLPRNCLSIRTRDVPVYTNAPGHLVPVTLTMVVLLAIVILSIPFLRKYSSCQCTLCRETANRRDKSDQADISAQELLLFPPTSHSKLPSVNTPSSPGRPKHKLSKRTRGYASFATKNSHRIALTTVVEYIPDDSV